MITKEMRIIKVLKDYPETYDVFMEYELDCLGCMSAKYETIEQLSDIHFIDLELFLQSLNDVIHEPAD